MTPVPVVFDQQARDRSGIPSTVALLVLTAGLLAWAATSSTLGVGVEVLAVLAALVAALALALVVQIARSDTYRLIVDADALVVQRNGRAWLTLPRAEIAAIGEVTHQCSADSDEGRTWWTLRRWAVTMRDGSVHPLPFAASGLVARLVRAGGSAIPQGLP